MLRLFDMINSSISYFLLDYVFNLSFDSVIKRYNLPGEINQIPKTNNIFDEQSGLNKTGIKKRVG